jgi:aminoglycoside phosphotransferase (APT) family kinase protein
VGGLSTAPAGAGDAPAGARAVRAEDAFDVAAVDAWLTRQVMGLTGPPAVSQFTTGASNLTYLLRYPERDLILRRPPPGTKAASAHDMAREHRVQAALRPVFPYVPEMVALCIDHAVLGGDFYVMERVPGTVLQRHLPPELGLDAGALRRICESFVDRLVDLHRVDPAATDLADLGRGPGYVRRQVDGWSRRYRAARTWHVPSFEGVMRWLAERQPADVGACVIHNDFRLDNVVLAEDDPERVAAILDWEMATVGDPLMDLGGATAYWVEAGDDRLMRLLRRQPTHLPGMLTRRELVERYVAHSGRDAGDWPFYEAFGLFRLATIAQQIYYRYHHRQTRNPAFRHFWLGVRYLHHRCRRIMRGVG